jgi:DNA ligase (NAD+)
MSTIKELKELTEKLANASYSYEQLNKEIMSNKEYDALYDKLLALENELGVVMPNSPTQKVGYEVMSQLKKVEHPSPMLSLDKTKDKEVIKNKFYNNKVNVSYKLDGLTVVLTYKDGELQQAVTRGNGLVGEDVTHTVKHTVPTHIPFKDEMVLRGEAVISYADFSKVNNSITNPDEKYKNPRNLASGTVRSLDSKTATERYLNVVIFECLTGDTDSKAERLKNLKAIGFNVVDFISVTGDDITQAIDILTDKVKNYKYPVDGLVTTIDSVSLSKSLGTTGKFPKCAMAFKWQDTEAETVLREIEWSPSRTGLLNPVAIFDPVELEGTTVTRASLHNLSYVKDLELGIGDRITVYKANMIIPQVSENLTRSGFAEIPDRCPVCGESLSVEQSNDTEVLVCNNKFCSAKLLGRLTHFVSRDAMNIKGLSEGILTQLLDSFFVTNICDLYELHNERGELLELDKMGETKVDNLLNAIENSREPKLANFINALAIPNIGLGQAKVLAKHFKTWDNFHNALREEFDFTDIQGFGVEMHNSLIGWYDENYADLEELLEYISPKDETTIINTNSPISGKTFVITGDVYQFKNRKELQARIEELGGKATGSVSAKTDYLINNDVESTSNKNKKAKELGIPIISEQDFLDMIN